MNLLMAITHKFIIYHLPNLDSIMYHAFLNQTFIDNIINLYKFNIAKYTI